MRRVGPYFFCSGNLLSKGQGFRSGVSNGFNKSFRGCVIVGQCFSFNYKWLLKSVGLIIRG